MAIALDDSRADCLACYTVPAAHRVRGHTTNGRERFHQELKRRTRVGRLFPTRAALPRLGSALAMEQSEAGVSGRRDLSMESPEEVTPAPATSVAQAA